MRQYSLHIIICFLGLFLINGCQDEDLIKKNNNNIEEGIPVVAKLSFRMENREDKVITRGALDENVEYKVHDLYVYVFRKEGDSFVKEFGDKFTGDQLGIVTTDGTDKEKVTTGSISLNITSGKKKFFAIANAFGGGQYSGLSESLSKVKTLDDLNSLVANLASPDVPLDRSGGYLLMSGSFAFEKEKASSSVTGGDVSVNLKGEFVDADGNDRADGKIYLDHLESRMDFNVVTALRPGQKENGETSQSISFIPKGYRVVNIPVKSYLLERPYNNTEGSVHDAVADSDASEASAGYRNSKSEGLYDNFDHLTPEGDKIIGGVFSFYMFENRKRALNEISDYAERERQNKTVEGLNGDYANAHKYATYVEIVGTYQEIYLDKSGDRKEKTAEVKYTVHLGFLEGASDFKSKRNTKYTYKMTIRGVDNIELEVTSSNDEGSNVIENQPGAEGDVVKSKQFYYVDAHYIVDRIVFNKDNVSKDASFRVKTPFDKDGRGDAAKDINWVWFVQNKKERKGKKWNYPTTGYVAFPKDTAQRINIKDLIQKLKDKKSETVGDNSLYDSNGDAAFTVFIDEFYYEIDPTTNKNVSWSKFVNGDNREMHILCDTEFSQDKESSLTTSNFLISQKPIRTFYNTNQLTGWGVESVNEPAHSEAKNDGRLPVEGTSEFTNRSGSNGRYNMFKNIGYQSGSFWATYIDSKTNKLIRIERIALLQQACLQRNRDLDGDGKITHDEVRWYLPAINQMTGLFLGRDALPLEVQLMKSGVTVLRNENDQNSGNYREFHYTNSNNLQFWAEEGAATGSNGMNDSFWNYRCVRNLGVNYSEDRIPGEANETKDYASRVEQQDGSVLIDLSAVNPNALRKTDDKGFPLAITDELSEYNRPYTAFYVRNSVTTISVSKNKIYSNEVSNPCPEGWRIPNMRELTLISAYGKFGEKQVIFSQTKSSLSYKSEKKNVYHMLTNGIITLGDIESGVVRCVKDRK